MIYASRAQHRSILKAPDRVAPQITYSWSATSRSTTTSGSQCATRGSLSGRENHENKIHLPELIRPQWTLSTPRERQSRLRVQVGTAICRLQLIQWPEFLELSHCCSCGPPPVLSNGRQRQYFNRLSNPTYSPVGTSKLAPLPPHHRHVLTSQLS